MLEKEKYVYGCVTFVDVLKAHRVIWWVQDRVLDDLDSMGVRKLVSGDPECL